jgi:hypothetical protein
MAARCGRDETTAGRSAIDKALLVYSRPDQEAEPSPDLFAVAGLRVQRRKPPDY